MHESKQLPASALTFENGEPDGSDREPITRKVDNSGWVTGEQVVNGDFSDGLSGWVSSNAVVTDGIVTFTGSGFIYQDIPAPVGVKVLAVYDEIGTTEPRIPAGESVTSGTESRVQFNGDIGDSVTSASVIAIYDYATGAEPEDNFNLNETQTNGKATGFFDSTVRAITKTQQDFIFTKSDGRWRSREINITPFV